jgi:hypothetical protein
LIVPNPLANGDFAVGIHLSATPAAGDKFMPARSLMLALSSLPLSQVPAPSS